MISVTLNVNGTSYPVEIEPQWTLLRVLREELGLTGTKEGCGAGDCGACTVLIDGQAINSCLYLAIRAEKKKIVTIEGLSQNGRLHPLQQAFIDAGAVQCGFCTPGMILRAHSLLNEIPRPDEDQIRKSISGNLCRCTGYVKIVKAIQEASRVLTEGGEVSHG